MEKIVSKCDGLFIPHIQDDHCDKNVKGLFSLIVYGREDELCHSIDHGEAFWLTYYKMEEVCKISAPYVIMGCGGRLYIQALSRSWHGFGHSRSHCTFKSIVQKLFLFEDYSGYICAIITNKHNQLY